eukprot:1183390-Prorocentrum_minimum.AAC.1
MKSYKLLIKIKPKEFFFHCIPCRPKSAPPAFTLQIPGVSLAQMMFSSQKDLGVRIDESNRRRCRGWRSEVCLLNTLSRCGGRCAGAWQSRRRGRGGASPQSGRGPGPCAWARPACWPGPRWTHPGWPSASPPWPPARERKEASAGGVCEIAASGRAETSAPPPFSAAVVRWSRVRDE